MKHLLAQSFLTALPIALAIACSASGDGGTNGNGGDGDGSGSGTGTGTGTGDLGVGTGTGSPGVVTDDPQTCADAEASKSYVGCDFWPTVLANPVFVEYDFAVVVANGADAPSEVTVTGPAGFSTTRTVQPGALETILLPWVDALKGPEFSLSNTSGGRLKESIAAPASAYHLTATVPITAWQFNPLQYKKPAGTGEGQCGARITAVLAGGTECRAASNDASLLLPTTAMTGNYRVGVYSAKNEGDLWGSVPGGFGITATADDTQVVIELSSYCFAQPWPPGSPNGPCLSAGAAGSGIDALGAGEQLVLTMNAGDVVQLVGAWGSDSQLGHADLSGSVINASKPVQVIGFNAIAQLPDASVGNADHLEDTILPAEVIGKKYFVTPPTAYGGAPRGHVVRIYGNVDGTVLTYPEGKPDGAPDTIDAGQMVQLPPPPVGQPAPQCAGSDLCYLTESFVVEADQPFMVASFMLGGDLQVPGYADANAAPGDPSYSILVTPEQFRTGYTFLAPADFMENYADVLVPDGATAFLDGAALTGGEAIGASGWSLVRAPLSGAAGGIHTLTTEDARGVGLQVMGFGNATSYYYPGGLNLKAISEPPTIVIR